jgi:acylpyruvate hydrolase
VSAWSRSYEHNRCHRFERRKGSALKLLTLDTVPGGKPGALVAEDEIVDLRAFAERGEDAQTLPGSVRQILEGGEVALAMVRNIIDKIESAPESEREGWREIGLLRSMKSTPLLAPVPDPWLVLSAGLNYKSHLAEMSGTPAPPHPAAFIKVQASLTGCGKPIVVPQRYSKHVDFEGEFTIVMGRTCHDVSESEAMQYVAGYTIANDVSARDWIPEVMSADGTFDAIHAWERNIMGKNLPTFTPCGPVITTADEIADPHKLRLTTTLNGEVMQDSNTDDLLYNVPQLISHYSKWYKFRPGDLITTGTPAGVGVGRDPQVFMHDGDLIEVSIEGIGKLSNPVVAGG